MLFQLPRSKSLQICVACFVPRVSRTFITTTNARSLFQVGRRILGPYTQAATIAGAFLANAKLLPFINVEELLGI